MNATSIFEEDSTRRFQNPPSFSIFKSVNEPLWLNRNNIKASGNRPILLRELRADQRSDHSLRPSRRRIYFMICRKIAHTHIRIIFDCATISPKCEFYRAIFSDNYVLDSNLASEDLIFCITIDTDIFCRRIFFKKRNESNIVSLAALELLAHLLFRRKWKTEFRP